MKRKIATSTAALPSLLLAVALLALPLLAKNPAKPSAPQQSSTMSPSNIGNVSAGGQSLIYKRPRQRRHLQGSPSDIGDTSPTRSSLRYRGRKHHARARHHHRKSSRR